jgi:predicted transposase YbfD/YdcC
MPSSSPQPPGTAACGSLVFIRLLNAFASVPDPRERREPRHLLGDILVIAVCTALCGHSAFTDMEDFACDHEHWLRTFLELPGGIPSHDTFNRVFQTIDTHHFEAAFRSWTAGLCGPAVAVPADTPAIALLRHLAIDGKVLCGSKGKGQNRAAALNVWNVDQGLVFAQRRIPEEGSEITQMPLLLRHLQLKGTVVSMDAAHCQSDTISLIVERGGEWLVSLRDNQPTTAAEITPLLDSLAAATTPAAETTDKGHGRIEIRRCWVLEGEAIAKLECRGRWKGLNCALLCERTVIDPLTHRETTGRRIFMTSLPPQAAELAALVRRHWQVESTLHWSLDVLWREDDARARTGYAATNLSLIRKTAVNLLKLLAPQFPKMTVARLMKKAARRPDFLYNLLSNLLRA